MDGSSSQKITQDAAIGAVLSVAGPGKAAGTAIAQKIGNAVSSTGREANTLTKAIEGVASGTVSNAINGKVSADIQKEL